MGFQTLHLTHSRKPNFGLNVAVLQTHAEVQELACPADQDDGDGESVPASEVIRDEPDDERPDQHPDHVERVEERSPEEPVAGEAEVRHQGSLDNAGKNMISQIEKCSRSFKAELPPLVSINILM